MQRSKFKLQDKHFSLFLYIITLNRGLNSVHYKHGVMKWSTAGGGGGPRLVKKGVFGGEKVGSHWSNPHPTPLRIL